MSILLPVCDVAIPPVTLSTSLEEPWTTFLKLIVFIGRNWGCRYPREDTFSAFKWICIFTPLGAFTERDLALKTAFLFSLSKACTLMVILSLTVSCLVLSMHLLCLPWCSSKQALLPGECFSLLSALPSPFSLSIWLNWSSSNQSQQHTRVILSWDFPDEISLFVSFLTHPYSKFEALGGIQSESLPEYNRNVLYPNPY